jgi:hypothetical protein
LVNHSINPYIPLLSVLRNSALSCVLWACSAFCGTTGFTDAVGQTECKSCAAYRYPAGLCITPEQLTSSQRDALVSVSVIVSVVAVAAIAGVIYYRKSRVLSAPSLRLFAACCMRHAHALRCAVQVMVPSSPILLCLMLFGVVLICMCCVALVQLQTVSSCKAQIWLLCFGFYFLFGPLIAKYAVFPYLSPAASTSSLAFAYSEGGCV